MGKIEVIFILCFDCSRDVIGRVLFSLSVFEMGDGMPPISAVCPQMSVPVVHGTLALARRRFCDAERRTRVGCIMLHRSTAIRCGRGWWVADAPREIDAAGTYCLWAWYAVTYQASRPVMRVETCRAATREERGWRRGWWAHRREEASHGTVWPLTVFRVTRRCARDALRVCTGSALSPYSPNTDLDARAEGDADGGRHAYASPWLSALQTAVLTVEHDSSPYWR
ncbi:hypothetical protein B0H19DRAFT_1145793, partial [Mycena capillaripes]